MVASFALGNFVGTNRLRNRRYTCEGFPVETHILLAYRLAHSIASLPLLCSRTKVLVCYTAATVRGVRHDFPAKHFLLIHLIPQNNSSTAVVWCNSWHWDMVWSWWLLPYAVQLSSVHDIYNYIPEDYRGRSVRTDTRLSDFLRCTIDARHHESKKVTQLPETWQHLTEGAVSIACNAAVTMSKL